ncbi:MAG TPA: hypothetical protein VEK11_15970 [Thermoanaerobaculia bacterium]|nr:hypothetical protein [Thermoanaerobaculia bacterium]
MSRNWFVLGALATILVIAAAGIGVSQSPPSHAVGRQYTPPWYIPSPEVPPDVVMQQSGAIGFDPFVNDFAWNTFVALSWPASGRFNGVPDRQNVIGGVAPGTGEGTGKRPGKPNGPTVWETFKDTSDIYLNPPTAPTPFNEAELIPPACKDLAAKNPGAGERTMLMTSKTSDVLRDTRQAFTHAPLVDLNGNLVWYEVKVNEVYYDYVVKNKYYDSRNQPASGIEFPMGANDGPGIGAIRVKAAWKEIAGADDAKRFYTTTALTYDAKSGKCEAKLMGLVGLHVVQKTAQFPRWVWATFEHADNAPTQDEIDDGSAAKKKWSFYDPASSAKPNQKPVEPYTTPVQVVRVMPIHNNAAAANALFRPAMATLRDDNVWQNYILVAAQWGGPNMSDPARLPVYAANTTMETYLQEPIDDPNSPHGCINCHNKFAPTKDGDFQLRKAWPKAPAEDKAIAAQSLALPGPR